MNNGEIVARARILRRIIESLSINLTDSEALESVELFPAWDVDEHDYAIGDRVRYEDVLYKCVQAHDSRQDRNPADAVSLWARVLIPDPDVIPDWVQPESTNPYMTGDKVRHNGKIWISTIDYNVYEPGVAGWDEVTT